MATARKRPARKPTREPKPCPACEGTGEKSVPVRVGRKRRTVDEQSGLCLNCLGSVHAN